MAAAVTTAALTGLPELPLPFSGSSREFGGLGLPPEEETLLVLRKVNQDYFQ